MSWLDWVVLFLTLVTIVIYGSWKTRKNKDLEGYLKGNNSENWMTIGLSIMATQASAITFLSTPGKAYEDGMGFAQFYFGLPLAMIIISAFFLPIYYRLKVFTAYEYLERRFDVRVRAFTAFLFLLSRGLAAGITIYAPSIILSTLLGWNLELTCVMIGGFVIFYTVSGGSRAVSLTQKWQMTIIMGGMITAFFFVVQSFPESFRFSQGVDLAGSLGKMEIIDLSTDFESRYTMLSGLTGGLFLFLSYFGTDQSQVQRYLGGKSLKASRIGLMFNGLVKIPMQILILFIGVMVFVSYQFNKPPIVFNDHTVQLTASQENELKKIENAYDVNFEEKRLAILNLPEFPTERDYAPIQEMQEKQDEYRTQYKEKLKNYDADYEDKDGDYVFLTYVLNYLPTGLIGLLLAVIFSAAMSSTAGELNALASTTTIDFYKKFISPGDDDKRDLSVGKWLTVFWGLIAIGVALVAGLFDNLIELVNILGSLFYGTILGVFLVAFFFKGVKGTAAFIAGLVGQAVVLFIHLMVTTGNWDIGFLMYNIIGSVTVILVAICIQIFMPNKKSVIRES
ncbi:MAG: sodium:solute symporter [Fluviicola sp. XM-24bin1]|nr:MAG: sodium:solute symporter [Fluviicola sp. XM-24bin1]